MTTSMSMLFQARSACDTTVTEILKPLSNQVFVKDEVVFPPTRDPYLALAQANERLRAGLSLLSDIDMSAQTSNTQQLRK